MKKIFYLLAVVLCAAFASCSNDQFDNYVKMNDRVCYDIKSAYFTFGPNFTYDYDGYDVCLFDTEITIQDLKKQKEEHRLDLNRDTKVKILAIRHLEKTYEDPREYVDYLRLEDIPDVGTLIVHLNQGVYEGDNELVSDVRVETFDVGTSDKETGRRHDANFKISVTLKDGRVIDVRYAGEMMTSYELQNALKIK